MFGPKPRSYRTDLPRKVRQSARQSALNARAGEGAIYVIEALQFTSPKTRDMVNLLRKLELNDKKVLVLTETVRPEVFLSSRNIANAEVMRYADASAYDVLWADALVIEESAIGGHAVKRSTGSTSRAKRVKKVSQAATKPKKSAGEKESAKKASKKSKTVRKVADKKGNNDA